MDELLCPTPCPATSPTMFALAARNGWQVRMFDASRAFEHTPVREGIFLQPPAEVNISHGWALHLKCTMYGLSEEMADSDAHLGGFYGRGRARGQAKYGHEEGPG